ncbi:hypothetical protein OF83DRAFT_1098704 [Amylostereum chailletii]|nr:hypothetical protein OF83DRAFT_1098704 [Amylostereum chailletii]
MTFVFRTLAVKLDYRLLGAGNVSLCDGEDVLSMLTETMLACLEGFQEHLQYKYVYEASSVVAAVSAGLVGRLLHDDGRRDRFLDELKAALGENWYLTMKQARDAGYSVGGQAAYKTLIAAWKDLGSAAGLDEDREKARFQRHAAHYCSWKECTYYIHRSATALQVCRGCEARYCGRTCQKSDWKEGGHKARCRRLKGPESG